VSFGSLVSPFSFVGAMVDVVWIEFGEVGRVTIADGQ
jgi:hypothetical protein